MTPSQPSRPASGPREKKITRQCLVSGVLSRLSGCLASGSLVSWPSRCWPSQRPASASGGCCHWLLLILTRLRPRLSRLGFNPRLIPCPRTLPPAPPPPFGCLRHPGVLGGTPSHPAHTPTGPPHEPSRGREGVNRRGRWWTAWTAWTAWKGYVPCTQRRSLLALVSLQGMGGARPILAALTLLRLWSYSGLGGRG